MLETLVSKFAAAAIFTLLRWCMAAFSVKKSKHFSFSLLLTGRATKVD